MGRNIVICCDGTAGSFGKGRTNVGRLIECLALDDSNTQVAVYDQGIGTNLERVREIEEYCGSLADPQALRIPARSPWSKPWLPEPVAVVLGQAFGYGLRENVGQIYRELHALEPGPDDRVFLFGFSRGAFTVRALAGLLHRCGLPCPRAEVRFPQAWKLYDRITPEQNALAEFLCEQQKCRIHFLGLWDTVKSYGGFNPTLLPHLRHNPAVDHVRHALALDERRAWFQPTTWGLLDTEGAMARLDLTDYAEQTINEVWFSGCHSDIGGRDDTPDTGRIAMRWMLGEATTLQTPLHLNAIGHALLAEQDPDEVSVHSSQKLLWRLIEQVPRLEIDNSGLYPEKHWAWGSNGRRHPSDLRRLGLVTLHTTVKQRHNIPGRIAISSTQTGQATGPSSA